jgi:hypothetical protein
MHSISRDHFNGIYYIGTDIQRPINTILLMNDVTNENFTETV